MKTRAANWIWFRGRMLGPYLPWEVSLVLSKCRSVLVFDPAQGWMTPRGWNPGSTSVPVARPRSPSIASRARLWIWHRVFRRLLRLYH